MLSLVSRLPPGRILVRALRRVFLNIDLGELSDEPPELYAIADVANIACGGHAGDDNSMRRALALCDEHGALPGAHPSYPDRSGFGRRRMDLHPDDLAEIVGEQCARLATHADEAGLRLEFVKPHGALYHDVARDPEVAGAVVAGVERALGPGPTLIGPPTGAFAGAAAARGLAYAREGFADRARREVAPGRWELVPRDEPGALVTDPAFAQTQALELAASGAVDTICVHGDTPGAVAVARAVRHALESLARQAAPEPLGDGALRLPRPVDANPAALLERLRAWPRVVDVVIAERHVAVYFDPARPPEDPTPVVQACRFAPRAGDPQRHVVRVVYDGPDLAEVAQRAGLSVEQAVDLHAGRDYVVRMIGFLPGFAYLGGLDPRLVVPRRDAPRPRIPAGAVGLAGPYTGVYPFESPGGWNLIGRVVDFAAFTAERGAALRIGDVVRFERAA